MAQAIKKFRTANEAVLAYLVALLSYCGIEERSVYHQQILAKYRMISPLPRKHNPTVDDSWCAIFLSAIGWATGFRRWPWECSCSLIRTEAKARGIWRDKWAATVKPGMWCLYDWDKNGSMDHIGAVVAVIGNEVWVVEGNYSDAVKIRRIQIGDERVAGFVDLDYSEMVELETEPVKALRPGDSGGEVRALQAFLAGAGYYLGNLDGDYGNATTVAVMGFQAANGLEVDGKAGPITQAKIKGGEWAAQQREVGKMPEKRYNSVDELPGYAQPYIRALADSGALAGRGDGELDLSEDMVRTLVVCSRAFGVAPAE